MSRGWFFSLTFGVRYRYDHATYAAKKARTSSGSTSLRVSKHTAAQLRAVQRQLEATCGWSHESLGADALLDALLSGALRTLAACNPPIAELHAAGDPDAHANPDVGECMQNPDPNGETG